MQRQHRGLSRHDTGHQDSELDTTWHGRSGHEVLFPFSSLRISEGKEQYYKLLRFPGSSEAPAPNEHLCERYSVLVDTGVPGYLDVTHPSLRPDSSIVRAMAPRRLLS